MLACCGEAAAGPALACPPQEQGIGMIQNASYIRRWSEYCGVPEAEIVKQTDSTIKLTINNCLRPQRVDQARIDQTLAAGRSLADQMIAQMPDKTEHCSRVKHAYDNGK